jgi:imidazolonepropionase-like amidohydrolase
MNSPQWMLAEGVVVGLDADMPTHDLFNVMRSASQQHTGMPREQRGLLLWAPLEMATVHAARALNLQDDIGALEPGRKAGINTSLVGPLDIGVIFPISPVDHGRVAMSSSARGVGNFRIPRGEDRGFIMAFP